MPEIENRLASWSWKGLKGYAPRSTDDICYTAFQDTLKMCYSLADIHRLASVCLVGELEVGSREEQETGTMDEPDDDDSAMLPET